jgi:UDP-N-acetylglucosamine--N-acetylmuramyl-(pentapeptide) pyrophosphoryl-undecaprenol N-acetylglucosamine transferase
MKHRFIISGGGTGGHIFPALAIANRLKKEFPDAEFLFIGAEGKMEMSKVKEAGYNIIGLQIYGISRNLSFKSIVGNLKLPFVVLKSIRRVKKLMREFKPDIVIGVGGFASGPALRAAIELKIPTLIQEQNSFPGITNKLLAKKVNKICVAYSGLEKYFPKDKIVQTGNPVRDIILNIHHEPEENVLFSGLQHQQKTVLVVGGSLGARTINECLLNGLEELKKLDVQVIWQTGELFYKAHQEQLQREETEKIKIVPFITEMDKAYRLADIIVSRAGAIAISELAIVGKPVILIPFPYAAEDHQTKNAQALADQNAAIMIADGEAKDKLLPQLTELIHHEERCHLLAQNISKMKQENAIDRIIQEIIKIISSTNENLKE